MSSTSASQAPPVRRGGSAALWVLQIIAALGFLGAALQKLTGAPEVVATFEALGWPGLVRYALAVLELLGCVGLVVPRLAGVAGLAFVALTIGAITVQVITGGSVVPAVVLLAVSAMVALGRRRRTSALWLAVRARLQATAS